MTNSASDDVLSLIQQRFSGYSAERLKKTKQFYEFLVEQNETQNLTRLTTPDQFVEGHFRDVHELIRSGFLDSRNLDLGSGCGVPGILCAAVDENSDHKWIAVDSERSKVDFLVQTIEKLHLESTSGAVWGRVEEKIDLIKPITVVSRAVGKTEKLYNWILKCSTWNKLILFKGPSWAQEWEDFNKTKSRGALEIENTHEYKTADEKSRVIIQLRRVPRGTKKNLPK